jgi:16S rRNA C967 or C1407 C5-methylase (RsmB/RsmF family)/NOL1/NOP2/fmu family ribosome biogenesis protein
MLPGDFLNRIETQKYIDAASLINALEEPSPVSIRVNRNKWDGVPMESEPVPWCKGGYYLHERPSFTLDSLFHAGCYYPREASGMFLDQVFAQVISLPEKARVLDLCGAPGGKSTHLADFTGKDGMLISNEVIRSRAPVLAETMTKWGTGKVLVSQNDPSAFRNMPDYFDMILVDAPCSGEGMFRTQIAVDEWSMENAAMCAERQKRIISDIWPAIKENGYLVYSTCTFNPDENERNIRWLVSTNEAECIRLDVSSFPGIAEIDYEGIFGYGFYPGRIRGEGFFISVIRKTGIAAGESSRLKNKLPVPGKKDIETAAAWTGSLPDRLFRKGENLIALPCESREFMSIEKHLNIIAGGTLLGFSKKDEYIPSPALALSQLLKKDAFPVFELDYGEALRYLKRENLSPAGMNEGWNIVTYNGVNLGFVKNIGKRTNNYFPVEWRIRMNLPEPGSEKIIKWSYAGK